MTKQNTTIAIIVVVLFVVIFLILYYCVLAQRSVTPLTPSNGSGIPSPPVTNGSRSPIFNGHDREHGPIRERNGNMNGQDPGHGPIRERGDVQHGPIRERPEPAHLRLRP